ncbi:sterigmatocystin biosynthesis P450 monooxygenase stcS [Lecanosticta acicola]|uniref:Sterigmatocystin biosynthesis P450 monooxygenase stcS n=1 Tax=Lecanosticta acicola TaxID=111012 RepID=A0AAI9ECL9_9PEZI|nr:sterigmatocystin biosynthesis P450 monooxygenase stcS [Lecanosticta acicola]
MLGLPPSATWAVALVALTVIIRFFIRLHYQRSLLKGLPGPPRSYAFGSLISMGKAFATQPPNAAPQASFRALKDYYDLPDTYYVDTWPMGPPIMIINDLDIYNEIAIKNSHPKHPLTDDFMQYFGGPGNLVTSEGQTWKKWRAAFNPGFSTSHLMTTVPMIVDECQTFCDIMAENARNNTVFRMEVATTKLTVNIIGKIVLDLDFNAQRGRNVMLDAFNSQTSWSYLGVQFQPSELWDIRRPIMLKYNNWKMNKYLSDLLDKRFAARTSGGKTKHVVDLALESYMKEVKGLEGKAEDIKEVDPEFKQSVISNMKTFIFAGHDTTSSVLCYAFYYLSQHPDILARIRREHDEVFGPDPDQVADKLRKEPHLLNKLDYTLAVTKEVLRIQPPASSIRAGLPGEFLHNPETGERYPTENFMLFLLDTGLHRHAKYFPDPHTFNPERFLPGSEIYNRQTHAAWIAFSKGPRNCIGQELALMETKVILAMILRRFDFVAAYEEVGELAGDGSGYPSLRKGVLRQFGERAYQVQRGTAKPSEGMPCRLRERKVAR